MVTLPAKRGGLPMRLLRTPIAHSHDRDRVVASRWMWRECEVPDQCQQHRRHACYVLTPLGVLHALTGLRLEVKD